MSKLVDHAIEQYAYQYTKEEPDQLREIIKSTKGSMESPGMLTGRLEGRFLCLLVKILQPKLIIEIGTFTGYSALSMAEGLPADGRLITCEINPKAQRMAQQAFDASPYGSKIELREGPALDTLRSLDQTIDMAFIDADKDNYPIYYEEVVQRTRSGGLILIDNMFRSGRVLDPKTSDCKAVHGLNESIHQDERVENVLLTIRDGVQMVYKR